MSLDPRIDLRAEPLERMLRPAYDEGRSAAAWRRICDARRRTRRQLSLWMWAAPMLALAAVLLVWSWPRSSPLPQALLVGDHSMSIAAGAIIGAPTSSTIKLDDGSLLELGAETRLQVLNNDGAHFTTFLQRGRLRAEVRPGSGRRWEIETPLATVEVIGTAFTVAHDGTTIVVEVEHGVVMVRGERVPNRIARLTDGDRLVVEALRTVSSAAVEREPKSTPARIPTSPLPARTAAAATSKIAPAPAVAPVAEQPSLEPLAAATSEADRLRASGDFASAAMLLERAVASHPDDPSAGLVEFALGRLYLESLGNPKRAAQAFASVVRRGSPSSLLEDAYARTAEALWRAGESVEARIALERYREKYPSGRRLERLQTMIGVSQAPGLK